MSVSYVFCDVNFLLDTTGVMKDGEESDTCCACIRQNYYQNYFEWRLYRGRLFTVMT